MDNKAKTRRYKNIVKTVLEVLNFYDPLSFDPGLDGGSPENEYEGEAARIASFIVQQEDNIKNNFKILQIEIDRIWQESFSQKCSKSFEIAEGLRDRFFDKKPLIEKLKDKLKEYPMIEVIEENNQIEARRSDAEGFSVYLLINEYEYTVGYATGWHEHFESADQAYKCFLFGLSNKCRLRILSRGKTEYRWILEFQEDDKWFVVSSVGLLFFPFWRKKTEKYLMNKAF